MQSAGFISISICITRKETSKDARWHVFAVKQDLLADVWEPLPLLPGKRAKDTVFSISNSNNKRFSPHFTSCVFFHITKLWKVCFRGWVWWRRKPVVKLFFFTDPLQKMTTPAVAIYQQPHHKKKKTFPSPTTEALGRTGKKGLALSFPSAQVLTLPFVSPLFFQPPLMHRKGNNPATS